MFKQARKGLFLATALLIYLNGNAQETKGVKFENGKSWEQLKAKAKQEHKYIFLDVYATWCGPCKKMDQEVYINENLGTYVNSNFISAKVQIDSTDRDDEAVKSNYAFAKKISTDYKVSSFPSFLFFDSEGNLIHRNEGANSVEKFKQICETAVDPLKNNKAVLDSFYAGYLEGDDLLKLARRLRYFKEDSLAFIVAKKYKSTVLDKRELKEFFKPGIPLILQEFPKLYAANDSLIKYVFQHQKETDESVKSPGFSKRLVDYYIWRDNISPKIQTPDGIPISNTPSWNSIEKEVLKEWGEKIAKRTVVSGKVWYYGSKKDYVNQIKYEIAQVELNGVPSAEDVWGAMGLNNIVYNVIFKYSNDPIALKKAAGFMKILTENYPTDHAKMDTYANVLYKSGQKKKAIEIERKALKLAQLDEYGKENVGIYSEVIQKMEKGGATWKD